MSGIEQHDYKFTHIISQSARTLATYFRPYFTRNRNIFDLPLATSLKGHVFVSLLLDRDKMYTLLLVCLIQANLSEYIFKSILVFHIEPNSQYNYIKFIRFRRARLQDNRDIGVELWNLWFD